MGRHVLPVGCDTSPAAKHLPAHWPLQGTQRGAAAGFKLDTLLKLADVKGTDRKTSLLHFVIMQARRLMAGGQGGPGGSHAMLPPLRLLPL